MAVSKRIKRYRLPFRRPGPEPNLLTFERPSVARTTRTSYPFNPHRVCEPAQIQRVLEHMGLPAETRALFEAARHPKILWRG